VGTGPHAASSIPHVPLRSPDEVMRLNRMGAFFPTRLSFMRQLIRALAADNSQVTRPVWEMDKDGYGRAVYSVLLGGDVYSLVAFSTPLEASRRTDRVIAEAWDSSYVLFDGIPTQADLNRLETNAPKQEAGRFEPSELVLSRANKSVRLFEHVVDQLSKGEQPNADMVASIGYLMRTTAVYGNGKFGSADRVRIASRPRLTGPYQAEMLAVWLIRGFTHDLVEHIAKARSPETFAPLALHVKRNLGIGNATGLGMAPFLVNHGDLLNNWMQARETALARVRALAKADPQTIARIGALIARTRRHLDQWNVADERQMKRIEILRREFSEIAALATPDWLERPNPWDRLMTVVASNSLECQELIVALVLEPHGNLIDVLGDEMASDHRPSLDPAMTLKGLAELLRQNYQWALDINFGRAEGSYYFWYVSEEKLEPRLGRRCEEPGADLELPLDIARQAQALHRAISVLPEEQTVAAFLATHPEHRYITRRVQASRHHAYGEIHDNLLGASCLPIDMLRCKLSFFGASKFDPKSDRWTRITLYQGAPLFDEISDPAADDWWLPVLEEA